MVYRTLSFLLSISRTPINNIAFLPPVKPKAKCNAGVERPGKSYMREDSMKITYEKAASSDIECLYQLCKQLIDAYENVECIDYERVLSWVRKKLEASIDEYISVYADGKKVGYYHFYKNEDGEYELGDLYVFPEFQNRGIGTAIIEKCCASVEEPVMLYVFIKNKGAVSLYKRLGFEITETIKGSRYIMKR